MTNNILFTCAGRRHYLLDFFKQEKPANSKLIATDMQSSAPALALADRAYLVPAVDDIHYIDEIKDICCREKIKAIISLNDLELPVLAKHKKEFEKLGVLLIVSDEKVIDTCFDKYKTIGFASRLDLKCPKTYLTLEETIEAIKDKSLFFPIVLKPRWGSASIGIEYPETLEELHLTYALLQKKLQRTILLRVSRHDMDHAILFQEKMIGKEFGVDVINDLNGNTMAVYVKEKLAMRAGETDKAVLRNNTAIKEMGWEIGQNLKHIGNLDCDIFDHEGQLYLLEMNPRFGGGYPFSHMSGANIPAAIYSWLQGKKADSSCFQFHYDKAFAKCDMLVEVKL